MKRKKLVFLLILSLCLASAGCGKSKDASESTTASESTSSKADSSSEETDAGQVEEAYPAADPNLSGEQIDDTPGTESTKSEGLNNVPGTVVELSKGAIEGKVGETYTISEKEPHFTLSVDKLSLTDERTALQEADRVLRVTYTYTSLDLETLLVGQYSFKALNDKGEVCEVYYFDSEEDSEANFFPVGSGESYTAAIGFIAEDTKSLTLVYDDQATGSDTEIYWTIDLK